MKELGTLLIASIETIKRQKMKYEIDEVLKLVHDFLKENISRESLDKTLQFLTMFWVGYVSPYWRKILVETLSI